MSTCEGDGRRLNGGAGAFCLMLTGSRDRTFCGSTSDPKSKEACSASVACLSQMIGGRGKDSENPFDYHDSIAFERLTTSEYGISLPAVPGALS